MSSGLEADSAVYISRNGQECADGRRDGEHTRSIHCVRPQLRFSSHRPSPGTFPLSPDSTTSVVNINNFSSHPILLQLLFAIASCRCGSTSSQPCACWCSCTSCPATASAP
eukprot:1816101-Rhodomonas_salina.1